MIHVMPLGDCVVLSLLAPPAALSLLPCYCIKETFCICVRPATFFFLWALTEHAVEWNKILILWALTVLAVECDLMLLTASETALSFSVLVN